MEMHTDTATIRLRTTPEEAAQKAATLIEALPWLEKFHGEVVVVKYGGNAMVEPGLTRAFAQDMVFLRYVGLKPVVIHGGGPQITRALTELGIPSEFRGGLRVTSPEAMPVVRHVLVNEVAAVLVAAIDEERGSGIALPGDEHPILTGVRKGIEIDGELVDLGLVGEVTEVDPGPIREALEAGRIPVISTVAREAGTARLLNVNADSAAAAVAIALDAAKLVVLTDVPGLYADWPNRDSIVSIIPVDELRPMLPDLEAGMIPKMTACVTAVDGGVAKAAIVDGRTPHSILLEIFTSQGVGTEVVP